MAIKPIPRPKSFDLELHFKLNGVDRFVYAIVKACVTCKDTTVFEKACSVCGRFSPHDKPVYFQIARLTALSSIPCVLNDHLHGLDERSKGPAKVLVIPKGGEPDGNDPGAA